MRHPFLLLLRKSIKRQWVHLSSCHSYCHSRNFLAGIQKCLDLRYPPKDVSTSTKKAKGNSTLLLLRRARDKISRHSHNPNLISDLKGLDNEVFAFAKADDGLCEIV